MVCVYSVSTSVDRQVALTIAAILIIVIGHKPCSNLGESLIKRMFM